MLSKASQKTVPDCVGTDITCSRAILHQKTVRRLVRSWCILVAAIWFAAIGNRDIAAIKLRLKPNSVRQRLVALIWTLGDKELSDEARGEEPGLGL